MRKVDWGTATQISELKRGPNVCERGSQARNMKVKSE
jgi:hypothetical protein